MKAINVVYYLIALAFPLVLFLVLLDNYNETHPVPVFALCIGLTAIAGLLSSAGFPAKNRTTWVLGSIALGVVEALLLAFAF